MKEGGFEKGDLTSKQKFARGRKQNRKTAKSPCLFNLSSMTKWGRWSYEGKGSMLLEGVPDYFQWTIQKGDQHRMGKVRRGGEFCLVKSQEVEVEDEKQAYFL